MIENNLAYINLLEAYGCSENMKVTDKAKEIGLLVVNDSLFAISHNPIVVKTDSQLALGITGLSGAGKDAISNELITNGHFELVRSLTTRKKQERDIGSPYIYINKEEFERKIDNGDLIEFIKRGEDYMGLERGVVDTVLERGKIPIIRTGPQAIGKLQSMLPDLSFVSFFVIPESWHSLQKRLVKRDVANCISRPKTEAREDVRYRLNRNRALLEYIPDANFLLINRDGKIDEATSNILSVIDKISNH